MPPDVREAVSEYVAQEVGRLGETYQWKIPQQLPEIDFVRKEGPLYVENLRLRQCLSQAYNGTTDQRRRHQLATWYIAVWGGVRRNKPATIATYIAQEPTLLADGDITGVASWSKLLSLCDPDRYVIFDARVSAALSALQIINSVDAKVTFKALDGRNTAIKLFNAQLKKHSFYRQAPFATYRQYLDLLRAVDGGPSVTIPMVEMTLFGSHPVKTAG